MSLNFQKKTWSSIVSWLVLGPLLAFVGLPAHAALDDWTDGDGVWSSIHGLHADAHETGVTKAVKKVNKKKILPRRVRAASKRLTTSFSAFEITETPVVCALSNFLMQGDCSRLPQHSFRVLHNGFGGHLLS